MGVFSLCPPKEHLTHFSKTTFESKYKKRIDNFIGYLLKLNMIKKDYFNNVVTDFIKY